VHTCNPDGSTKFSGLLSAYVAALDVEHVVVSL
jgi:hypothetical protein